MRLCYFGHCRQQYIRNRVILKGLEQQGVDFVKPCLKPDVKLKFSSPKPAKWQLGLAWLMFICKIFWTYAFLSIQLIHRLIVYRIDAIMIGHPYQFDVLVASLIGKLFNKPIIFDSFVMNHETAVIDRQAINPNSCEAKLLHWVDRVSLQQARLVLSDTQAHAHHIANTFQIDPEKIKSLYVGEDPDIFKPAKTAVSEETDFFEILFVGTYVPLHGIKTIIQAAKHLEDFPKIRLTLVGKGQTFESIVQLTQQLQTRNISFKPYLPLQELPALYEKSDVGLGIFGTTEKAQMVIPIKVYSLMAMKKPIITMDTTASREILTDNETALLTPPDDPVALAKAIKQLYHNKELRSSLAHKAHQLFNSQFTPKHLGHRLIHLIQNELQKTK